MKKALIITTVSGFVPQFELNNVKLLQSMGYEVHYAANYHTPVYTDNNDRLQGTGILAHQIDFVRSPFHLLKNIHAFHQLTALMRTISFDLVHCHTPMGGVLGRLAAQKTKTKPVLYTAHGFHFYKGAPIWNWVFFYPVERWLARYTDVLITINQEDYARSSQWSVRGHSAYVKGVGIPIRSIQENASNQKKEAELNINKNSFVLLSVGELNHNKNHQVVIRAIKQIQKKEMIYLICGKGDSLKPLQALSKQLGIENQVRFLGYRTDIYQLLHRADIYLLPSFREGLSASLMEAMAAGLPVVCSDIRGNRDLIRQGCGGYRISPNNVQELAVVLEQLYHSKQTRKEMGRWNQMTVKKFDSELVGQKMKRLYKQAVNIQPETIPMSEHP